MEYSFRETERIYIRPIQHTDASAIFAYRSLECVAQYQYWEPFTMQKSLDFVEQNSCVDMNAQGVWIGFAIIMKSSNELIGDCALKIDGHKAEIGCNISPKHQLKGYAQDALNLLVDMCFEEIKVSEVFGITDSENLSSIKMMQSLGMGKMETFENKLLCKERLSVEHKYYINKNDK